MQVSKHSQKGFANVYEVGNAFNMFLGHNDEYLVGNTE